jgi:hypothetical protein
MADDDFDGVVMITPGAGLEMARRRAPHTFNR